MDDLSANSSSFDSGVDLGVLRRFLTTHEFTAPALAKQLGIPEIPPFRHRLQALPLHRQRLDPTHPLPCLIHLFVLRQAVAVPMVLRVLGAEFLEVGIAAGLLQRTPGSVEATMELLPYQDVLVVSDWPTASATQGSVEPVMGVAASTRALAQLAIRKTGQVVLDAGTGCGILALLAAKHAGRVIGSDLNPRAVQLAALNARLNGISNAEFRVGNWFEPVRDERFDLILCNPPFVISPASGWLHSHSGHPLDHLSRQIARQAVELLREEGYCQIVCNWAHIRGEDWQQRLQGWFVGLPGIAWVWRSHTEDMATYAWNRVGEWTADARTENFQEWISYYERERIEAVSFGTIAFRRTDKLTAFRCENLPELAGPCGVAIERRLLAFEMLHTLDDEALLHCRVRAADRLSWETKQRLHATGWNADESRLRLADGFVHTIQADAGIVDFLGRCRERRSLSEHLADLVRQTRQEQKRLLPEFLKVVRRLLEVGYLLVE